MALILAWRPLIDPVSVSDAWWVLLGPLALGISVAYKAVRVPGPEVYLREVLVLTAQIILIMALLWIGSLLFIEYLVPAIAP